MRDLTSNIAAVQAVAPAVLTATTNSSPIDLADFDAAAVLISTGAIVGAGDFTPKLQESSTPTPGDFTDVADGDLTGAFPASLSAASVYKVGYRGSKRYVRLVLTQNGGTSIAACAMVVKSHAAQRPVA